MDCSLRELMTLIKEVNPDARRRGTTYDFAIGKVLEPLEWKHVLNNFFKKT